MSSVMPVTSITLGVTVIEQVAFSPFEVSAVIVTVPAFSAVTVPFSTVAISLSEELQLTVLSVAFSGSTVADNTSDSPSTS